MIQEGPVNSGVLTSLRVGHIHIICPQYKTTQRTFTTYEHPDHKCLIYILSGLQMQFQLLGNWSGGLKIVNREVHRHFLPTNSENKISI